MQIETSWCGKLEITPDQVITFPESLPGFTGLTRFAVVETGSGSPFRFLQSLEDKELALTIGEASVLVPGYKPAVSPAEIELLQVEEPTGLELYLVTVVPEDPREATVNLQAPIVINKPKRLGKQVVLQNDTYPLRYYLFDRPKKQAASR